MFQFNNAGLGMKKPDASSALPNSFGKVRTFKEDLENFGKEAPAKDIPETKNISPHGIENPSVGNNLQKQKSPPAMPLQLRPEELPGNPFQSVPTPPPLSSADPNLPAFKSSPSQSFFAENSFLQENILPENKEKQPAPPKTKSKILLLLIAVLALALAGGGFYYYWFYIKNNSSANAPAPAAQPAPAPAQTASTVSYDSQNKNLRQLIVDTSQDSTEIKSAVAKFVAEFAASASENDLVEVKFLEKDNQPIGKKDFFAGFGATIPDAVLMKLSEDYSLFAQKKGSAAKLGLVFKTVTSADLASEMKNWEPKITTDLASIYLGQTLSPAAGTFNSAKYKNADIRYFNFSSPADTSLDYSVISSFLIIGSSKDSMRSILDYMSEK